jgi:hypothetical protein
MISIFQQFEFTYPDGELFYDRSGLTTRRLREVFPNIEAKEELETHQREFSEPDLNLRLFFGVRKAQIQSLASLDKDFSKKAATFVRVVTDTLELNQLSNFSFRHVLGQACSSPEKAHALMWPMVPEDQRKKLESLSPLGNFTSFQAEFTQGNFAFESRLAIMQLIPHSAQSVGSSVREKLQDIVFPVVQFSGASVEEAIEFLRIKARDLDVVEPDASKKGVEILLVSDPFAKPVQLTLDLRAVPLMEALRFVADLAGMKLKIGPDAVLIVSDWDDGSLPHVTMHIQATGQVPIEVANLDVTAFIENIRDKHTEEVMMKLAPHLCLP